MLWLLPKHALCGTSVAVAAAAAALDALAAAGFDAD